MRTVMPNTDIPVAKDTKLTWREMRRREIDVVSIMKEDFIEKDKDRSKYGWLPKMTTCSKGSIGSLLVSNFCEHIKEHIETLWYSCARTTHKSPTNSSKLEYSKRRTTRRRSMKREFIYIYNLIYLHYDLPVSPPRTHHIHHGIHETYICQVFDSQNVNLSNLQNFCISKHVF